MADLTKPQVQRRIGKNDIIPGSVQQLHMAANTAVLQIGKAANRPKTGNNYCLFYYATDTHVFSVWSGNTWRSSAALT